MLENGHSGKLDLQSAMMRPLSLAVVMFCLGAAVCQRPASAQEPTAQALAEAASKLMAQGRYDEGCDQYARSERIDPTPRRKIKVAECNERRGRTATAWVAFSQALDMADERQDDLAASAAHDGLERIEANLDKIEVVVPDEAAAVAGLEIRRDGLLVAKAAYGLAVPVDPGKHVVSASAPGRHSWSVEFALARGPAAISVIIPVLEHARECYPGAVCEEEVLVNPFTTADRAPLETRSFAPASPAPSADPATSLTAQRTVAFILGGVGLTAIGAGALVGLAREDQAGSEARASTALLGLGVASLAAGVIVFLTEPDAVPRTALQVGPSIGNRSLGVSAGGSF